MGPLQTATSKPTDQQLGPAEAAGVSIGQPAEPVSVVGHGPFQQPAWLWIERVGALVGKFLTVGPLVVVQQSPCALDQRFTCTERCQWPDEVNELADP
jgi:hypothetical protein